MEDTEEYKYISVDVGQARHAVKNELERAEGVFAKHRNRGLTRDTRATVDGVIDSRGLQVLAKLKRTGYYSEICGCLSTGKEANVYGATALVLGDGVKCEAPRAIKIYKTSILVFRNRAQYVQGEHRFERGYTSVSNPRKMVRNWAEKEFRNLRRLVNCGLRCPTPIALRGHVIVMSLVGKCAEAAAPRLKEYISSSAVEWKRIYVETIALMRAVYQNCRLVHGDMSEFNILIYNGHPYIIDVSQSVETSHPQAERFLKRDCLNVYSFFKKQIKQKREQENHEGDSEPEDQLDADEEDVESDRAGEPITNGNKNINFHGRFQRESQEVSLNKRKFDNTEDQDEEWHSVEDCELRSQLESIGRCLSVEEMFAFITMPSVPLSGVQWPSYDWEMRNARWQESLVAGRCSEVAMSHAITSATDKQVHLLDKALDAPDRLANGSTDEANVSEKQVGVINVERDVLACDQNDVPFFVDLYTGHEEEGLDKIRDKSHKFDSLCGSALKYTLECNERAPEAVETQFLNVFMETQAPKSLFDLRDVDVEREHKLWKQGKDSKFTEYFEDNVCHTRNPQAESDSDSSSLSSFSDTDSDGQVLDNEIKRRAGKSPVAGIEKFDGER